jgi:hypothetical protein
VTTKEKKRNVFVFGKEKSWLIGWLGLGIVVRSSERMGSEPIPIRLIFVLIR